MRLLAGLWAILVVIAGCTGTQETGDAQGASSALAAPGGAEEGHHDEGDEELGNPYTGPPANTSGAPIPSEPPALPDTPTLNRTVRFLLTGDTGTQDGVQAETAVAMKALCAERGCDFAMFNGDNIYNNGPLLGTDDPQFATAFEDHYADFTFPVYLTLGNHDGGGTGSIILTGDYEVQYTYKTDKPSQNWQMPGRYYNKTFGGGLVEIYSIDGDTIALNGEPTDIKIGPAVIYDGTTQRAWLTSNLEASNATWKFAFGHYQYGSNGNYGDGGADFKGALEETICDRVQFYFHGHEHDMRWLAPQERCGRTEFIVSGAGAHVENRPAQSLGFPEYFNYRETSGFAYVEVVEEVMTVTFYGQEDGVPTEVFSKTVSKKDLGW